MSKTKTTASILAALALTLNLAPASLAQEDPLSALLGGDTPVVAEPVAPTVSEPVAPAVTDPVAVGTLHAAAPTAESVTDLANVTNVIAEAGAGSVTVYWDPVEGADHYTVHYSTTSVAESTEANAEYDNFEFAGNVTSYAIVDLTGGVEYYFAVTAENTVSTIRSADYSAETSATPEDAPVAVAEPVVEPEAVAEEDVYAAAAPEALTQTGPLTAALLLASAAGAATWRRLRS